MTARRALFALLLVLFCAAPALAVERDWNRLDDPMYEAIGLQVGHSTGFGLAYKFPVQWWLYAQVAGGIWNTSDDNRHNVGLELQYILRQDGRDKVFLGASAGHYYHKKDDRSQDHISAGFGVGIERLYWERAAVQLQIDFLHRGDKDSVTLFPQAGVYYYF